MWKFNTVQIFVTGYNEHVKQLIARLQPLGLESIYHTFGYQSPEYSIQAYVVGNYDKDLIKYFSGTGLEYTLSGPEGVLGIFYLQDIKITRTTAIHQTIRQDLPDDSPVYQVDLSLYKGY
jgi:hypothetical protein